MDLTNKKITGVLFDFEGTLVDFQWQLEEAVKETLSTLAGRGIDLSLYGEWPDYASIYNRAAELAEENNAPGVIEIISAIYDRYDADALTRWSLHADTAPVLDVLKSSGIKTGLVTSVGRSALDRAFDKFGLGRFLSVVVTRNDVTRIKPHPEGLIKAAEMMGTEPASTLFTGDSRNDVEAAHAAGMPVFYITGGERWPQNLPRLPVDLEISSLKEIVNILKAGYC